MVTDPKFTDRRTTASRREGGERRKYAGKFEGLERRRDQRRHAEDRRIETATQGRGPMLRRSEELQIRDLFNTIWRGKLLIATSFVIVMAITFLVVQQIVPRYTASASVMINSRKLQVVDVDDVLSSVNLDAAIVQTEVEVIRSRELIRNVVAELNLARPGAFARRAGPHRAEGGLVNKINFFLSSLSGSGAPPGAGAPAVHLATGEAPAARPATEPGLGERLARFGLTMLESLDLGETDMATGLWDVVVEAQMARGQADDGLQAAAGGRPERSARDRALDLALSRGDDRIGAPAKGNGARPDLNVEAAVNSVLGGLAVRTAGRSLVINIGFTSVDPELSAKVANTTAKQYLQSQLNAKYDASDKANKWLNSRITDLRGKVRKSEGAVERYRASKLLVGGNSNKVSAQQLIEINSQVIIAQTQRSEAQARYRVASKLLKDGGDTNAASEVFETRAIQNLRKEETKLLGKASELSARYEEAHPKMIKIRSELAANQRRLKVEIRKVVENLGSEVEVAKARERSLRRSLSDTQNQVSGQNQAEVKLRELQREAKANRQIYEAFLGRFKEVSNQDDIQDADARIISAAIIPAVPTFPRKNVIYGLAAGGALFLGLLLVFVRSRLDNRFKSPEEIEQLTGAQALGMIPFDKFVARRDTYAHVNIFDRSLFTEAIRGLHTSMFVGDERGNVICITSSLPSEGKTITTLSLARVAAMSGQKVLVIDCDLRRPSIHRAAKLNNSGGVVEYLRDGGELDELISIDPHSGAHVLTSKVFRGNPLDLLRSPRMEELLTEASEQYELVLLDTPSILAVSDPKVLSRLAGRTLYLVRWDGVPRDAVLSGIKSLSDLGTDLVGVAMTQVDLRKHVKYGYMNAGYYYGSYAQDNQRDAG
ncbi:MAG: Wzz/FepE/Etk N-terminal domain-containing protein [Rhodospirillales bacterium]|nr:Wzz/FepE/Etk N-terminal domain-containing protein [Rhodospirillales bacterium]MDP6840119.1 Wzz/FepE/Etk N-terminal domain-containing protein [Rhodospirillales bacterium]